MDKDRAGLKLLEPTVNPDYGLGTLLLKFLTCHSYQHCITKVTSGV